MKTKNYNLRKVEEKLLGYLGVNNKFMNLIQKKEFPQCPLLIITETKMLVFNL